MESIWCFPWILVSLFTFCSFTDCYDPLDPNGNVTVTFDILQWTSDGYVARVSIQNYYQYRRVDKPGWTLGFTWTNNEIIWSISGAIATHRGNCSNFKDVIPHSCMPTPEIVDLMPDAKPINSPENCCRGGLLAASAINPRESSSSFDIVVGNTQGNSSLQIPVDLALLAPGSGYTCSPIEDTQPTVSIVVGGRREEEVFSQENEAYLVIKPGRQIVPITFCVHVYRIGGCTKATGNKHCIYWTWIKSYKYFLRTWKSTCTYSAYLANKTPVCCVSLSTFYSPEITTCPQCSCGCRPADKKTLSCTSGSSNSEFVTSLDTLRCTDHMCPIRVHWHIKTNYLDHWRVKLTVTNLNYNRSYTNWNVLVHHPGLSQPAATYSFNTTLLHTDGISDDVALFWGISNYNTELLNADHDEVGSVSTEILLAKDHKTFTLHNGWALPRTIYFAGENCVMPYPNTYPMLPNDSSTHSPLASLIVMILIYLNFKLQRV